MGSVPRPYYILKARAQIGWNVPVVGDASFSSNPLPAMANASELQGVSVLSTQNQVYVPLTQHSPAFQTLYNAVLPASGTFEVPFLLYAFGWDDIMVLQAAATQAGSFTTQAMTQALENLNNPTAPDFLLGPYHYSSTQCTPPSPISMRRYWSAPTPRTASRSRSGRPAKGGEDSTR